jgi:hypothetical protein
MDLAEQVFPHSIKDGFESVQVSAGQSIKIETSPAGTEILNKVCPPHKKWVVKLTVHITETDVANSH